MGKRFMTVKGVGKASLAPDTIQIDFTLEARAESYDQTINYATQQLEELRNCLSQLGFMKSDLVTTQFLVDTDYESVKNEEGEYIRVFKGYIVRNNLKLSFPLDNKRLGCLLEQLSQCEAHPEFTIRYLLKNDQELKALIIQNAVQHAINNAQILAASSEVLLGEIISIEYDWSTIAYQTREFNLTEASSYSVAQIDLQPDLITASDSVTITWKLKKKEQDDD